MGAAGMVAALMTAGDAVARPRPGAAHRRRRAAPGELRGVWIATVANLD